MTERFFARRCHACGKDDIARPGGVMCFRYQRGGVWVRDYFHPKCFVAFKTRKE